MLVVSGTLARSMELLERRALCSEVLALSAQVIASRAVAAN